MTPDQRRSVCLFFISLSSRVSLSLAVFVYEDMALSTLAEVGDTVELKCDYHLDTALYSIKVGTPSNLHGT